MRFITSVTTALVAFISVASAAQFTVLVGKGATNTFDPPSITGVQNGDTLSFQFQSKNHTATQSSFAKPCEPLAGGVDSGYQPVAAGATTFPEWTVRLDNTTAPLWFYCKQAPHCSAAGMVFAVNPTAEKTFQQFQDIAKGVAQPPSASGVASPSGSANLPAASTNPLNPGANSGAVSVFSRTPMLLYVVGTLAFML